MIFFCLNGVSSLAADFSSVDSGDNFLAPSNVGLAGQNLKNNEDFIFPLKMGREDEKSITNTKTNDKKMTNKQNSWRYIVKKKDTLWSISKKFNVPIETILTFNNLNEKSVIKAGDEIFIPGVKPQAVIGIAQESKKFKGKFVSANSDLGADGFGVPVSGLNWGIKHSQNGSDIAASCGEPVYASKGGKVVESLDGWNSGYGNYILIDHGRGVYTLYGHLSLRVVDTGEEVSKGELIGYVGNTGYTVGQTGCHLHFEIRGRANPLLK